MKIAYLSDFFPFSGFNAKFNSELFLELKKNNSVTPYTYYYSENDTPEFFLKKRKIIIDSNSIDANQIIDTGNPVSHKSAIQIIADDNPGLFITKFTSHSQNHSIGSLIKNLKEYDIRSFCIIDDWNENSRKFFNSFFFKYYLEQFDAIFVASNEIKKQLTNIGISNIIEIFDYPIFNNFGYKVDKFTAKKKLNFNELSKTILYPIPFIQKPEIDILLNLINKTPDDMRFIILTENPKVFELFHKKTAKSGMKQKIYLEYQEIFNSEVSVFFEAADVALLTYKNSYNTGLLSLCFNYNLPVISENHIAGNEIIEKINGGIVSGKSNPENFVNEITKYFNSSMENSFAVNIEAYKQNNLFKRLAEQIQEIYKKIS